MEPRTEDGRKEVVNTAGIIVGVKRTCIKIHVLNDKTTYVHVKHVRRI